jgi:hypothetical protein
MGFVLVFRRYAPFSSFGFGFEGDNRAGPSVSLHATARTIGIVPFERGNVGAITAESSGTEFLGLGKWIRKLAGKHYSNVVCSVTQKVTTHNSIAFTASTAGANPMIPIVAPDIDTFVDVRVEWIGSSLRAQGTVRGDDFPNAEVFLMDVNGTGCLLFDGRTTGGQNTGPMTRLVGSHESVRLGNFNLTTGISRVGAFVHARTTCSITKMQQAAGPRVQWRGAGGKFAGGGASSSW